MNKHPGNGHEPIPLNVPMLGGPKKLGRGQVGAQLGALPRKLDADGQVEVDVIQGQDGRPMPVLQRHDYLDAEELLQAIREIVREEVQRLLDPIIRKG